MKSWLVLALFIFTVLRLSPAIAAPSPDLWPRWQTHVANDTQVVDYSLWDKLLATYLVTKHPSGINRFRYRDVTPAERQTLAAFLGYLQQVKVSSLNPKGQKAYWPIYRDNRLHYALNCASLGCPNLQPKAFTAANTEELLEAAARAYINSSRGARIEQGRLYVSSIYSDEYDWRVNEE